MSDANHTRGNDPNFLELLIENVEIRPVANMRSGVMETGLIIKANRYNLENILCQMIDEYGRDELIKRIKALD